MCMHQVQRLPERPMAATTGSAQGFVILNRVVHWCPLLSPENCTPCGNKLIVLSGLQQGCNSFEHHYNWLTH